jgi:hypothetical protein
MKNPARGSLTCPSMTIAVRILVILGLVAICSTTFAQAPQTFSPTGDLNTGRNGHRAITLNIGNVLITGGYDVNENALASSELYSPATGAFTPTGSLNTARRDFGITLLDNGTVLVTGGYDASFHVLASAEIYDPATGAFTATGSLSTARADHSATQLNDGTVLIAGGFDNSGDSLSSAELYIPSTGTFVPTGSLKNARGFATATALMDGTVLISGGWAAGGALSSAEIYDPATSSFSPTGSLNQARNRNTATLMNGGNVLIAGGQDSASNTLASTELYNPMLGVFTLTGSLITARGDHAATLLTNGNVLVEGGFACDPSNCLATQVDMSASAETYDPTTGLFSATGSLATARQAHTATLLSDGTVLVAGGWSGSNSGLTSAELYQPGTFSPSNLTAVNISPLNPSLFAGTSQALTAIGTLSDNSTQSLASVIWNSSNTTAATVTNDSGSNSGAMNDSTNSGVILGVAAGTSTVSACAGAICGSTTVTVVSPGTNKGFALLGSPGSLTVEAGETATYSLLLMPVAGFSGNVTLSCAGTPPGARCIIAPPSTTLSRNNSATVTITTTASPVVGRAARPLENSWGQKGVAAIPAIVFLFPAGLGFCFITIRKKRTTEAALIAIFFVTELVACGGSGLKSGGGTPPGSYVINVIGTSGRVSRSTELRLIVK